MDSSRRRARSLLAALLVCGLASAVAAQPAWHGVWTAPIDGWRASRLADVTVQGDVVLAETVEGVVVALERASGAPRWVLDLGGRSTFGPTAGSGHLAWVVGLRVVVVEARTGSRVFERTISDVPIGPAHATAEVVAVPCARESTLEVVSLASGHVRWDLAIPGGFAAPPVALGGGRVGILGGDGVLRAVRMSVSPPSGERWTRRVGAARGDPLRAGDSLFVATERGVFALDAASGRPRWFHAAPITRSGAMGVVGDVLVVPIDDGVTGLALENGARRWSGAGAARVAGAIGDDAILLRDDGSVVLASATDGARRPAGLSALAVGLGETVVDVREGDVVMLRRAR